MPGCAFVSTDARVIDPDTLAEMPVGESGEIVMHGPEIFKGYWKRADATEAAFIEIDGKRFLVEKPIHADFALIWAQHADYIGNLTYSLTAHNFNPIMALAADTVIAEPDLIVPVGVIPPDFVKTPGVLVDHLLERAHDH